MLTALITCLISDLRQWQVVLQNSFGEKRKNHYTGNSSKLVTLVCCAGKGLEPLASGAGWPQETLQVSSGSEDHLSQVSKPAPVLLNDPCFTVCGRIGSIFPDSPTVLLDAYLLFLLVVILIESFRDRIVPAVFFLFNQFMYFPKTFSIFFSFLESPHAAH